MLSLWQVEMNAGSSGPIHQFDAEQIWTVVDGRIEVSVGGEVATLQEGDTLVLAPGAVRQVVAPVASRILVCGDSAGAASVPGEENTRGVPPWIA